MATPNPDCAAWIETTLGGTIECCMPLERWRDAWVIGLRRDNEFLPIYVRGDRNEEFPPNPLENEAAIFRTLGELGIPVPAICGICPDPHAIVMEHVPGSHLLSTARSEAERVAVLTHLGELMVRMHQLDIDPLVAAGVALPATHEDAVVPYFFETGRTPRRMAWQGI